MKEFHPGDVVLLSFPFVDAAGAKHRPAVVLLDTGDDDIVIARVTSQPPQSELDVEIVEWQQAGLRMPSIVRMHKMATVAKRMAQRKMGRLTRQDWDKIRAKTSQRWASL